MIKKFILLFTFIFLFFTTQTVFAQTTVTNNPDSPHELTLQVDKNQAVANGQDVITVTATLKDRTTFEPYENTGQDASPIANAQLILQVSGQGVSLNQLSQVTDTNGQIKAYLTATSAGVKTITVTDPLLNPVTYPVDYYQTSLAVTFVPPSTATPIPSPTLTSTPTPISTPTPTITPTPTATPTPWQPTGPIKTDPENSYFSIHPYYIGVNQTTTITIKLRDKNGNRISDEVPYVTATGDGNTIIQPTIKLNSLAYFSSEVKGNKEVTVRVGDMEIEQVGSSKSGRKFIEVRAGDVSDRIDISSDNPPMKKIKINAHTTTPVYFRVPKDRYVEKVTAVLICKDGQQLDIPLASLPETHPYYDGGGEQIFIGNVPEGLFQVGSTECTLKVTMEPPEEPDEPPIEVPIEPIDPFGTIYDAKTGKIVIGAVVTLCELQNGNWVIWDGQKYEQINPQTTDETGFYSFFVYPGKYYLTVEKEGYESFTSEVIEVIEEIVQLDVYLEPKSNTILWLLALLVPTAFVIGSWFIWRKKKTIITPGSETSQPLTP